MSDDRDAFTKCIGVAASADWITPTYEAARNIIENGRSFLVHSDDWQPLKWDLQRLHISFWGEALHWHEGANWVTFSVHADNAKTVSDLSGYQPTGGRGKAWLMLGVVAVVFFLGLAMAVAASSVLGAK